MKIMQRINAHSLAPDVKEWMANSNRPRILHVFDQACNLINERREILSIVTPQIGNGPFNLVVEGEVLFSRHLGIRSDISIQTEELILSDLTVNAKYTKLWNPHPNWDALHSRREVIIGQLTYMAGNDNQASLPDSLISTFTKSIVNADILLSLVTAQKLAGLGIGLTPSGDDFIMGAIYAAWIIHPPDVAGKLAEEITKTAMPLTTSLSAAWLRSAGMGEAGELWHYLFDALEHSDKLGIQESMDNILAFGETSGADALSGFIGVCSAAKERIIKLCLF